MSRPLSNKPGRTLTIAAYAATQSALATPSIDLAVRCAAV